LDDARLKGLAGKSELISAKAAFHKWQLDDEGNYLGLPKLEKSLDIFDCLCYIILSGIQAG
jgi:hypothetical protein